MRKLLLIFALTVGGLAQTWVDTAGMRYPTYAVEWINRESFAFDADTLSDAGHKDAVLFWAPVAGDITTVGMTFSTCSDPQDITLSLQDPDTATGNPDGTVDQSCNLTPVASSHVTCSLGTARTVTQGARVFLVAAFTGTVGNCTIAAMDGNVRYSPASWSYRTYFNGTSWTKDSDITPIASIGYGGTYHYIPDLYALATVDATATVGTSTTPDEVAVKFTAVPFGAKIIGAGCDVRAGGGDVDLVLYNSSDSVLASCSLDKDLTGASTVPYAGDCIFTATAELATGGTYRLAIKPTTTTALAYGSFTVSSAAMWGQMPGGTVVSWSERTDAGAWTDTSTKRPACWLNIGQIDIGAAEGGGTRAYSN